MINSLEHIPSIAKFYEYLFALTSAYELQLFMDLLSILQQFFLKLQSAVQNRILETLQFKLFYFIKRSIIVTK